MIRDGLKVENSTVEKETLYDRFRHSIYEFHRPLYHSLAFKSLPSGEEIYPPAHFIENFTTLASHDKEFLEHLFSKLSSKSSIQTNRNAPFL